jgi:hypothetical protein
MRTLPTTPLMIPEPICVHGCHMRSMGAEPNAGRYCRYAYSASVGKDTHCLSAAPHPRTSAFLVHSQLL